MSKNPNVLSFKPARLQKGKVWCVVYNVENPLTNEFVRKRIKVNHIKDRAERNRYVKKLIDELNRKLYQGWNPFIELDSPRGLTEISKVCERFIQMKEKELRADSMRSYNSFLKTFQDWITKSKKSLVYIGTFKKIDALDFFDYLYSEKNISNKTYNNYRTFFATFFNWLMENKYIHENPFTDFKKKKEEPKTRTLISIDERTKIREYLEKKDKAFLIVANLVYHSLIRPNEISNLKLNDFNFYNQTIIVRSENAKNRQDRITTIPDSLMPLLLEFNFNGATKDQYIFGVGMKPGTQKIDSRIFSKKWSNMRDELKLLKSKQLYSLRDTGIIDLLSWASPEEVMKQAGHSSLEITTKYLKHAKPLGSDAIKKNQQLF